MDFAGCIDHLLRRGRLALGDGKIAPGAFQVEQRCLEAALGAVALSTVIEEVDALRRRIEPNLLLGERGSGLSQEALMLDDESHRRFHRR